MSPSCVSGLSSHYRSYLSTVDRTFLRAKSTFIREQAIANVDPDCATQLFISLFYFSIVIPAGRLRNTRYKTLYAGNRFSYFVAFHISKEEVNLSL